MLLLHRTVKDLMNRLGQSNTVVLIYSKLKVLLEDDFVHPLTLCTHVSAPVHIRLCKRDKQKGFICSSSTSVWTASVKDVIAENMQEKWMGGGDGVVLFHSMSETTWQHGAVSSCVTPDLTWAALKLGTHGCFPLSLMFLTLCPCPWLGRHLV